MNIKKNCKGFKGITQPTYITKDWNRLSGYKSRGYSKRVRWVGISRMLINEPQITKHIKRNRIYQMVHRSVSNTTLSK